MPEKEPIGSLNDLTIPDIAKIRRRAKVTQKDLASEMRKLDPSFKFSSLSYIETGALSPFNDQEFRTLYYRSFLNIITRRNTIHLP